MDMRVSCILCPEQFDNPNKLKVKERRMNEMSATKMTQTLQSAEVHTTMKTSTNRNLKIEGMDAPDAEMGTPCTRLGHALTERDSDPLCVADNSRIYSGETSRKPLATPQVTGPPSMSVV